MMGIIYSVFKRIWMLDSTHEYPLTSYSIIIRNNNLELFFSFLHNPEFPSPVSERVLLLWLSWIWQLSIYFQNDLLAIALELGVFIAWQVLWCRLVLFSEIKILEIYTSSPSPVVFGCNTQFWIVSIYKLCTEVWSKPEIKMQIPVVHLFQLCKNLKACVFISLEAIYLKRKSNLLRFTWHNSANPLSFIHKLHKCLVNICVWCSVVKPLHWLRLASLCVGLQCWAYLSRDKPPVSLKC